MAEQARSVFRRYGAGTDVRVITFYNMQKAELEKEFKNQKAIGHISISSVSTSIRWLLELIIRKCATQAGLDVGVPERP